MELKAIVIYFGLIYMGLLLPKISGKQNEDFSTKLSDNMQTLLFSSNAKPMEQDDNVLTLQLKTNTGQETESLQNKITSRSIGLQSTFNKEPLTGETMKVETINKENSFTNALLSLEARSENNDNEVYKNSNRTTKVNGMLDQSVSLFSTKSQTLINSKFSSVQPTITKAVEEMPSMLHVTNATETSISVSWVAPTHRNKFTVHVTELSPNVKQYNDILVNSTSLTIPNLTCSGCLYNISVKNVYGNQTFSRSASITNYTVPMMPNVTVEVKPNSVIIKISINGKDCETLQNDQKWKISESHSLENCQIEKDELVKGLEYSLKIWRKVDVWESRKTKISFHLNITVPIAVSNLSRKFINNQEINITWQKPNNSIVTAYVIDICFMNPYKLNCTNISTNETHYIIQNLLPGSGYTVSVYAVNSIGSGPKTPLNFTTRPEIPDVVNITIHNITSSSVTMSLSRPLTFKGNILGYIIGISEQDKRPTPKTKIIIYHIICQNCTQAYASSFNSCSCSQPCNKVQRKKIIHSLIEPFSLKNLTSYTKYSIFAQAYTSAGCGNKSKETFMTKESVPSRVQNLKVVNKSSTWMYVTWEEPVHPNGKIWDYLVILYHNSSCIVQGYTIEKNFTFENLQPYQNYKIQVAANNSIIGENCTLEFKTRSDVPNPVKLGHVNATSKSITVTWGPPLQPNGPIKNYSIFWKNVEENISNSTAMSMETTYTITNLKPYHNYTIIVFICNDLFCKASDPVYQNTTIGVPYPARNVSADAKSATSISVHWQEPFESTGPTSYIIEVQSLKSLNALNTLQTSTPFINHGFKNTSIIITGLQEYWPYIFNVTTNTSAGEGATISTSCTRTQESTPGPVESLDIYVNYSCYIALQVTWKKPLLEDENGIIRKYEITYWADNNKKKKINVNATVFSEKMIVFGEHNYTIQIRAETSKGFGDIRNKTVYVESQIPIVPNDMIITKSYQEVDDSSRQIAINLPNKFFTDFTYGVPVRWGLVIAQSEAVNLSAWEDRELHLDYLKRWKDVYSKEISYPYRPTPTDWKPPYILTQNIYAVYILGEEEDCEDNQLYCNGYLKPNKYYRVRAFMCTKKGCGATRYSGLLHTDKDLTAIYITVPVLLIAACVAVNIIFIMWNKKLYCFKKKPIATVSSLVDGNQNGKINHSFMLKNCENTRPIMLAHFHSKVEMMKRDSNLQFCEEFKLLKSIAPDQPHVAAELQANRTKNRYTNILAYDHSRVKLLPLDDDEGSDYINANYIPGYSLVREYIAAQGPLHSTKDDFWRMIWEQNVSIVVMVTLAVERGRVKCEDYWPKGTEPVYFGDLVVQLKSESNLSDYVIRIMDANLGESTRQVKQFHFLKWPDFGCPQNTSLLINFVKTVRIHMPNMSTGPTLVHCSAGVGRTGTFIVIDKLLQHLQTNNGVDIFGLILELRKYRPNMVQTEDQYIYIYQCIADHLKQMENTVTEDIYVNESGM